MKKFVLDFSTWRCGQDSNINKSTGEGETYLLNVEGFSCCLGQVYLQRGVEPSELVKRDTPQDLYFLKNIEDIENDFLINIVSDGNIVDSSFSFKAMDINDDIETFLEEKLFYLDELFTSHNIEFSVINAPEDIMDEYLKLKNNTKLPSLNH